MSAPAIDSADVLAIADLCDRNASDTPDDATRDQWSDVAAQLRALATDDDGDGAQGDDDDDAPASGDGGNGQLAALAARLTRLERASQGATTPEGLTTAEREVCRRSGLSEAEFSAARARGACR